MPSQVQETNCVKFIEALQKVEANSLEFPTSLSKNLDKTSYNDYHKVSDFLKSLNELHYHIPKAHTFCVQKLLGFRVA